MSRKEITKTLAERFDELHEAEAAVERVAALVADPSWASAVPTPMLRDAIRPAQHRCGHYMVAECVEAGCDE